jgi:hypothetical protein
MVEDGEESTQGLVYIFESNGMLLISRLLETEWVCGVASTEPEANPNVADHTCM